ncbi:hypothetical protein TRFO_06884 [Tritrichomonas foetus]|uniref:Uncharacterized protein n=1 Tax=Tritrichomonas foetus TaxID=1144522 RepID=A0A1J4JZ95_9EUKA|nr:hypothetical protein TRFO_06884 [Tritrichomonas foetus]|eukprot:OHT02852.1 hypothetical protein TRFO_06884 [Tritrichomonas foetus]
MQNTFIDLYVYGTFNPDTGFYLQNSEKSKSLTFSKVFPDDQLYFTQIEIKDDCNIICLENNTYEIISTPFLINLYDQTPTIPFILSREYLKSQPKDKVEQQYKIIIRLATSNLPIQLAYNDGPEWKKEISLLYNYLTTIQPKGEILPPLKLLDYAKNLSHWILYVNDFQECSLVTEFSKFALQKFYEARLFGATSILSHRIEQLFERDPFLFPIDLELDDYNFFTQNFELIRDELISCDDLLVLLKGYQISLHDSFCEIVRDWIDQSFKLDIEKFMKIYQERFTITKFFNGAYKLDEYKNIFTCFNEFASLFFITSDIDIKVLNEMCKPGESAVPKEIVAELICFIQKLPKKLK